MAQIASDLGISTWCLMRWLTIDERESSPTSTGSGGESVELREAHERIKLLEQENEVLRRGAATARDPLRPHHRMRGVPGKPWSRPGSAPWSPSGGLATVEA
jgi:hypothetical protein